VTAALPATVESNDAMLADVPAHVRDLLLRHAGVTQRHIAAADETALDLGERACRALFDSEPHLIEHLDTLIFCTQSPDYVLPSNSSVLHGRLALNDRVAAFDLPLACSAYIYALNLASALVASGSASHVLIVTADTYSKYINPHDRSTRLLFGDGATATWLDAGPAASGVLDCMCGTDGRYFESFVIPAGGCRQPLTDTMRGAPQQDSSGNLRTAGQIHMNGRDILSFVSSRIPAHINECLARNHVTTSEIDWWIFHQASAITLDSLIRFLAIDSSRVLRHLDRVGNTVSSSIPLVLREALADDRIRPGQLVLLCGFGAGLSWGSALVKWGA
jgi:3-oxoacyl-[acyl-carrier-protein] synthase-3